LILPYILSVNYLTLTMGILYRVSQVFVLFIKMPLILHINKSYLLIHLMQQFRYQLIYYRIGIIYVCMADWL